MINRAYALLIGLVVCQTCSGFLRIFSECPNPVLTLDDCPVCDLSETDKILSNFYYKKLSAWLFKRSGFMENPATGRWERTIGFSVTSDQLDAFENPTDLRDLDAVISAILAKANTQESKTSKPNIQELVADIFSDLSNISDLLGSNSEFRFGLFVVCCALSIWGIHKRYKKNIIIVILATLFISGYFLTYLECNRKLEAEPVISFIKESTPQGFLGKTFSSVFRPSQQDNQIKHIREGTRIALPFCRPDHVLMTYVNDMFLHQLQLLVEKYVDIIAHFNNKLPWLYGGIAIVAFPILLYFVMKLVFEHVLSPVAWFRVWHESHGHNKQQQSQGEHSNGDRISGSNLQALLEIMANLKKEIKESSIRPSGVEQINEELKGANTEEDLDEYCGDKADKNKDLVTIEDIKEKT